MKQFITLAMASCLFLPSLARAQADIDDEDLLLEDEADMSDAMADKVVVDGQEQCANFAGQWAGSCEFKIKGFSRVKQRKLRIKQKGCEFVKVGRKLLPIGGQGGKTLTLPKFTVSSGGSANWNADKTEIEFRGGGSGVKLATGDRFWSHKKGSMKLDNGKLVVTVNGKTSKRGEFTAACSLDKAAQR